jgi:plasmid maintenance system antidote protein VapI
VFKSRGIISELVSGKRIIGVAVARKLGKFFNINPEVFLKLRLSKHDLD